MPLKLMYITNDLRVARIAEKYGVDRVWVDLETLGKAERQKNMDTVKSRHTIEDIARIAPHLTSAEMLVRINPWNEGSPEELEAVLAAGAGRIMLPMWKSPEEVRAFLAALAGRCPTTLLLETREAEACLDQVLEIPGIDEIHIGLNDLHLSYGLDFMFQLLSNGTVERICGKLKAARIPYGFGGIARIGCGALPAERIVLEHYRLGSTRAILSRSFCDASKIRDISQIEDVFARNMESLRSFEQTIAGYDREALLENQREVARCVEEIVSAMKKQS